MVYGIIRSVPWAPWFLTLDWEYAALGVVMGPLQNELDMRLFRPGVCSLVKVRRGTLSELLSR